MPRAENISVPCRVVFCLRHPTVDGQAEPSPKNYVKVYAPPDYPGLTVHQFILSDVLFTPWAIDEFVSEYNRRHPSGPVSELPVDLDISCFEYEPEDGGPVYRRRYNHLLAALDLYLETQN